MGFFQKISKHFFKTKEEADAFAARHNKPELLLKAFRPFFDTEAELRAFLRLPKPPKPTKAEAPALTPQALSGSRRYMPSTQFRVKPYKKADKPHLKFVVRFKEAGKYAARFFETKGAAQTFADARNMEVSRHGMESLDMPSEVRGMAMRCHNELAAFGKTIADATAHFIDYLRKCRRSIKLSSLIDEYCDFLRRHKKTRKHRTNIKSAGEDFAYFVGPETLVAEITQRQFQDYIFGLALSPASLNHRLGRLTILFNYAVKMGYADANPCIKVERFSVIEKPVGIVTPDELARLLQAARGTDLLPYFAISAFAGLRTAEVHRLDWSEINLEDGLIEVVAAKAKTAKRRLIRIQPCLAAWLRLCAKERGPVLPGKDWDYDIKKIAIREKADSLTECQSTRSLAKDWPRNALRHSFASYHLAQFKDAAALALEMGHSDTELIFRHYREVVRPKSADLYWQVLPIEPSNVVSMTPLGAAPEERTERAACS